VFGAGFGGMNQEIGFSLAGFPVPESEKTIFTGQFLAGINYQLAENFRLGARYRWIRVGKMDLFAYRSLHLAELSLGYVF
jgi:opacity protein-like surface antigen